MNNTSRPLHMAATGYVSTSSGSVAGANALLLCELLRRGHRVGFHSKAHFVDPRPAAAQCNGAANLRFLDCRNGIPDVVKRWTDGGTGLARRLLRQPAGFVDDRSYRRHLARAIDRYARDASSDPVDVALWLGTWAERRPKGLPTVSFVQGPPGTDARSVERHRETIVRLGGRTQYLMLRAYAGWRLAGGLPPVHDSDHLIVGSAWSRQMMAQQFGFRAERVHVVPYPVDLEMFRPPALPRSRSGPLRVLWLGRFVPRKRLDLFLAGLAEAIRHGINAEVIVVGSSAFVPNFEWLLGEFPYPARLRHIPELPRHLVPELMSTCDVLAQPSDEENFGSSVAEALACGMPVVVGRTNGTSDYVCERSIHLADDRIATFAEAIARLDTAKREGLLADPTPSRKAAECHFAPSTVTKQLEDVLHLAVRAAR